MLNRVRVLLLLSALALPSLSSAQNDLDSSGNGLLQGGYNFRQVYWLTDRNDKAGNLRRSVALTGTIRFDGAGAYSLRAEVMDSASNRLESIVADGIYRITASGFGFLSNPDPAQNTGVVWGLVSQGVFIGSSTELPRNDLFIAAPAASVTANTADFNGSYWAAELNFPSLTINQARDALFQLSPDGRGNLGTVNATGYIGGASRPTTQTIAGARYSFNNGVATVSFPGVFSSQSLLAGDRVVFFSPDGNFFFGGSNNGWNMLVGVRAASAATGDLLNGLYYAAGVDVDATGTSSTTLLSYYGAVRASNGAIFGHQRLYSSFDELPYDFTFSDTYEIAPNGTYTDFTGARLIVGAGGNFRIGFGQEGIPGISVALRAPSFSGPGVFLNPAGVVNAASRAPFTTGLARGEMIELSGTNLAPEAASDDLLPNTLSGVQVLVNDRLAPIKSVSPEKIVAIVPFDTELVARIRVNNNGEESATLTMFRSDTSPGVFTAPPGGAGFAEAYHSDSTPVTRQNPARPGEAITVRVTGLGPVDPAVPDGAPGPSDPPARATFAIETQVSTNAAKVDFAGLAPGLRGLYEIRFTVPTNSRNGDLYLNVSTLDAYTSQAQIPVAAAGRDTLREAASAPLRRPRARPGNRTPGARISTSAATSRRF